MTKHTILFVAANPLGTDRLALDEEARAIRVALERSGYRDRFALETRWAVRPLDLLDELRKLKPTVVHFSGHGGRGELRQVANVRRDIVGEGADKGANDASSQHGLCFQASDGRLQFVSAAALKDAFGAAGSSVQLVILNACYSEAQAEALLAHVGCVVGMGGSIRDDAARSFAIGFYGGLGQRQSVGAAYKQGCAAINLVGLPDGDKPQLRVRTGIDADQLVLNDYIALAHDLLTRDLAAWGGRHVFGNVPRERWSEDEAFPFLPLEELYVEPKGVLTHDGEPQGPEPLLALIERLTGPGVQPRVVVVTADFGSGKSLSARMIARRWAKQRLMSSMASPDATLPIYVRCADDFPSETIDLELTVRRAWKRQADDIGHYISDDDESLAWPSPGQRLVCLLDGLDEVALGEQHLRTLFERLRGKTTQNHRFVVFSRPGSLPAPKDLGANVVAVHVEPFSSDQVEQWLVHWNSLHHDNPPITLEDLAQRDLAAIAQTPILLFMVAFTWGQETTKNWPPLIAEIYEHFFRQVASGKTGVDPDPHRPIAVASERLLAALQNARLLDASAERPDAMLWLMGRVAWEAHMLEYQQSAEQLTRLHVENVLRYGDAPIPSESIDVIRIGLILTLQADLRGANHTILFGHKSFREFLVARHWATTLRRIVCNPYGGDPAVTAQLLGGRLLGHNDKSFDYLMQLINATGDVESCSASPLGWTDEERERLVRWAQGTFQDERQEFGERARPRTRADATLCNDQRVALREAALAIGSTTRGSDGMRMNSPLALRSMLAWFWLTGDTAIVNAPRSKLRGAKLNHAILFGADLRGADLREADLSHAELSGAKLSHANLRGAALRGADLSLTELVGVELSDADFSGATLIQANLGGAGLRRARLLGTDLGQAELSGADLRGAELRGANLVRTKLRGADLSGVILRGVALNLTTFSQAKLIGADLSGLVLSQTKLDGANLSQANMSGAHLSQVNLSQADLSQVNLSRADLSQVNLRGARLRQADLRGARLSQADLTGADLRGADLRGAKLSEFERFREIMHDETTMWPDGFAASIIGAAGSGSVQ